MNESAGFHHLCLAGAFVAAVMAGGCHARQPSSSTRIASSLGPSSASAYGKVEVKLVNQSGAPIYVRKPSSCSRDPGWFRIGDRRRTFRILAGPCTCDCDSARCDVDCHISCPKTQRVALPNGQSTSGKWDGYVWKSGELRGDHCERRVAPSARPVFVQFCWSGHKPQRLANRLKTPECHKLALVPGKHLVSYTVRAATNWKAAPSKK